MPDHALLVRGTATCKGMDGLPPDFETRWPSAIEKRIAAAGATA